MKKRLTDAAVKSAKPKTNAYKMADGGGLYLFVTPHGGKVWRYKYRIAVKEGTFIIGKYPALSLASARAEHAKARELVNQGTHPRHHRVTEKLKQVAAAGNTFKAIATDWIAKNNRGEQPDLFIGFTDGEVAFAKSHPFPTIWASSTDKKYPFGQVVRVNKIARRNA